MTQTNWLPGILVLAGSLLLAAVLLLLLRRKQPIASAATGLVTDGDRQAQLLLDQLNELLVDKHQLTDTEFVKRKEQLERQAAEALRAREKLNVPESPLAAPARAPSGFWVKH